jgi:hypothetical protein
MGFAVDVIQSLRRFLRCQPAPRHVCLVGNAVETSGNGIMRAWAGGGIVLTPIVGALFPKALMIMTASASVAIIKTVPCTEGDRSLESLAKSRRPFGATAFFSYRLILVLFLLHIFHFRPVFAYRLGRSWRCGSHRGPNAALSLVLLRKRSRPHALLIGFVSPPSELHTVYQH